MDIFCFVPRPYINIILESKDVENTFIQSSIEIKLNSRKNLFELNYRIMTLI